MRRVLFAIFFIMAMLLGVTKIDAQAVGSFDAIMLSSTMPPQMPDLDQPPCPLEGNLWEPGYWSYDSTLSDYYWVPGDWVKPPDEGLLWTPPYWDHANGLYNFHPGYWGTDIGFYGGVDYGFGYFGSGYSGGTWKHHHFHYNTAVTHVDKKVVHNTYVDNTVVNNAVIVNHVSFNGPGGIVIRPRPEEERAMREHHLQPTQAQVEHQQAARENRSQFVSSNHGRPAITSLNTANRKSFLSAAPNATGHTNGTGPRSHTSAGAGHTNRASGTGRRQGNTAHNSTHTRNSSNRNNAARSNAGRQSHSTQQHTSRRTSQQTSRQQRTQPTSRQRTQQPRVQQQRIQQPRQPQQQRTQQPKVQPRRNH